MSTGSSATIGISFPVIGCFTNVHTIELYLSSAGCTANATSPKQLSGIVVETAIPGENSIL